MTSSPVWHDHLGLAHRGAPEFIRRVEDLDALPEALAGAHLIRRAWESMDLDGALCIDGAPVAYFKVVRGVDPERLAELHRRAWNQGVAPMVVIVADTEVRVYSTYAAPRATADELDRERLITTLDRVADALELRDLADALSSGSFVASHRGAFDPAKRVDRYLVTNLVAAGTRLAGDDVGARARAHLLLAQVLFTCYLVDRGVIGRDWFAAEGIPDADNLGDVLERPDVAALDAMKRLLTGLHRDFNGDVFGVETITHLNHAGLEVLRDLLRGGAVGSGQQSLGFWPYDFRVIPIETLSAVYEEFLEAEDPGGRADSGAFYTPRTLAEFVLDIGLPAESLLGRKVLDPSCGSGVFLVAVFHRMVEAWRRSHANDRPRDRARALRGLLCDHLFGVDKSETACRITALGLYLAWLDHLEAPDIQELLAAGAMLPPLVDVGTRSGGRNIVVRDFFEGEVLPGVKFDLVVGNPPWGSAAASAPAVSWCSARKLPLPRRQLACAFAWKAADHLAADGRSLLILPASVVYGWQALDFLASWMSSNTVRRVVQLADARYFLFPGSRAAAVVVASSPGAPRPGALVEVISPLVTPEIQATDRLAWGADDVRIVPASSLLPVGNAGDRTPSREWKLCLRASGRDRRLLRRLFDLAPLEDRLDDGPGQGRWVLREGFNKGGSGEAQHRPLLEVLPFVSTAAPHVVMVNALRRSEGTFTRRYPDERVFSSPHLLFAHGAPRTGERIRAGYCAVDCVFTHSIRGLHAPAEDDDQLRFLACVLASPLAVYVLFHTSSSFGIGREKVLVDEYRRFPFPPPQDPDQQAAFAAVVKLHRHLELVLASPLTFPADEADRVRANIDEQVFRYYELDDDERLVVRWTMDVVLPSAMPSRGTWPVPAWQVPSDAEMAAYCRRLGDALSGWTSDRWAFRASLVASPTAGLGVVVVERGVNRLSTADAHGDLGETLDRLRRILHVQRRGDVIERGLKVFDGSALCIVKPLRRREWGEAVALSDADEIAGAILTWKTAP